MKTHSMSLESPHFNNVVSKKKKYEIRIFDEKRQTLRLGDQIEFTKKDGTETVTRNITQLMLFDSFYEALHTLSDYKDALPDVNTIDEGVELYEKIPYKSSAETYGIVVIKLA